MNEINKETRVFSVSEIIRKFKNGYITANVEYQRDAGLWNVQAKTLFIESLYYRFPVPPVYVFKKGDIWEIVDGQQRLTTINDYFANSKRINKKYFEIESSITEIPEKFDFDNQSQEYNKFMDLSIEVVIISNDEEDIKFELFTRLNRGSVPLSSQELRTVLYRSEYNNRLVDSFKNSKVELTKKENRRKIDEEEFYKFTSLIKKYQTIEDLLNISNKEIPDTKFSVIINEFMSENRNLEEGQDELVELDISVYNSAHIKFREIISYFKDEGYDELLYWDNRTLYLAIMYLSYCKIDDIEQKFAKIFNNEDDLETLKEKILIKTFSVKNFAQIIELVLGENE